MDGEELLAEIQLNQNERNSFQNIKTGYLNVSGTLDSGYLNVSGDVKLADNTAGLWVKNKDATTVLLRPSGSNQSILISDD